MASNYTTNYGLCQWQPGDKFLREEFNQDNEKLDTVLERAEGKADRALSGLEDQGYNLYNLLLQSDYESKYTGYKKALLYDGFIDRGGVSATGGGLFLSGRGPTLCRTGQSSIQLGYGSTTNQSSASTANQTIAGAGRLTSFTVAIRNNQNEQRSASLKWTVTVNNKVVSSGTHSTSRAAAYATLTETISPPGGVLLGPGDVLSVGINASASGWQYKLATEGTGLGGVLNITPLSGVSGTLTTVSRPLPACGGLAAWVRHTAGRVTLSAGGQTMTAGETRETADVQGTPCRETAFRLPGGRAAGTLAFQLGLALDDGDDSALILDYGAVLLP